MKSSSTTFPKQLCNYVLALFLVAATGCRTVEETRNPVSATFAGIGATAPVEVENTSSELSRIQFDDIPVPPGFFFRNHRNESYSFVDGDVRLGRFVYWGQHFGGPSRSEYLELLAKDPYNWSPVSSAKVGDSGPWTFEKDGERCVVNCRRFSHDGRNGDVVTVSVGKHLNYDDENFGKK